MQDETENLICTFSKHVSIRVHLSRIDLARVSAFFKVKLSLMLSYFFIQQPTS